ncbi:hypothetical protein CC115_14925 [Salmonella enterica]|nr:hypothetical protein [Salmonella enterica]
MYRAIWLLRCRVPPGEFKESVTSLTNKNDITHAHSWVHRNAGKLLFAGGVLQPSYITTLRYPDSQYYWPQKRIDNPANPNGKNSYPQTLTNYPITSLPTDAAKK